MILEPTQFWTIGEAARRIGVSKEWVRRLGELGILNPASRTQQGARLYRPEDVARFAAQREEARARRASKTP